VLTEATRGENVDGAVGEDRGAPRALESEGRLEERRREPRGRGVRGRVGAAKAHLEQAVRDDPELRRLLDEVQRRELDPLTAVREIMEKVFKVGDARRHRTLADIQEARERLARIARVTPVYASETFSRRCGREVVLKAENLQRPARSRCAAPSTRSRRCRAASGGRVVAASAGQPRPGGRVGRARAGISATIFVPQDAPMAKVEPARTTAPRRS
jgi:hypothetical protein